jgi:hypothetical protein
MTEEDRFIEILGLVESDNGPRRWGDSGRACGRFQDHPSYYCTWGPIESDFGGQERTWDWAFEFASRAFFRAARAHSPGKTLAEIAMARHLHGQIRWDGADEFYAQRWRICELRVTPRA